MTGAVLDVLSGEGIELFAKDSGIIALLHLTAKSGRLLCSPELAHEIASNGLTYLQFANVLRGYIPAQLLATNLEIRLLCVSKDFSPAAFSGCIPTITTIFSWPFSNSRQRLSYASVMLYFALRFGDVQAANQILIQNSEMLDIPNLGEFARKSVLHLAAEHGCATLVSKLLAKRPSLIVSHFSKNVLRLAAENGHEEVVIKLLAVKPALARQVDDDGFNALHMAALARRERVAALLLAHDPGLIDVENRYGETPLHLALCQTHFYLHSPRLPTPGLVKCLLAHKPAQFNAGMLRWLMDFTPDEVMKLLLQYKPELVVKGKEQLLHRVFGPRKFGEWELFSKELMLQVWQMNHGALRQINDCNETPFHVAVRSNNQFAIELVQDKLPFDEIMDAFATCNKEGPLSVMDKLRDCLLGSLNKDLIGMVLAYLTPPPKARGHPHTLCLHFGSCHWKPARDGLF